jgi:hypothetical protein
MTVKKLVIALPVIFAQAVLYNLGFYLTNGTNFMESEFTQWRVFLGVRYSPSKTWPKCAPQLAHTISTRRPSASGTRFTAPGISSSKLGQPQCDSNLVADSYKGVSHLLHTYTPSALLLSNEPVNGRSVPLCSITYSSSGVKLLYSIIMLIAQICK